jgi:hypothetical protein
LSVRSRSPSRVAALALRATPFANCFLVTMVASK